ncbi:carbohydrate ABC transporter substrate-binding protein (CUT1 family) [Microterricola gilva]|uniref:Carbohydrate ABC transporter substrate-binding protein (CUT1 family) n=1 Tax=Microterricola gilva TaxID=393267 RepID=A0A4Q8AR15_9MICO|nr:extracellular solute-binding protein [Microterricola gilva]RZU66525.1 carbohydrate ABC transporter substrate-binding protein (CUT1 family) [Microterricola gilva]
MRSYLTKRNRVLLGAALITVTAVALTGCGRASDTGNAAGGSGAAIDDKPATGTVELWAQGADGDKLPDMIAEFKKSNPDVEIELTKLPGDQFASKMTAAITAGTVPDLIFSYTEDQPALLNTDGFDPMPEGLVKEDDFFSAMWANSIVDDVQYGVPWYTYANVLIYRTDLAQEAGVAAAPKDWDELRTFAEDLKSNGVEFPLALAASYDKYTAAQVGVFAVQNGGSLLKADRSAWTINDPKNVEALEFWSGLIKDGLSSADGPQFLDTVPWSSQGKNAAIVDGGPWFASWFDDANGAGWGADHLAFVDNPTGPGGDQAATTGGGSWFVPKDAKNKDAAWKFSRFMSEPTSQVKWYELMHNMPALRAAWEDPALQGDPLLDAVHSALEHGVGQPNVSTWSQVGDILGKQIETVVRGDVSAQDALDAAQQQAESIGVGQ